MKLYHFTCDHGARHIRETGELRPMLHPVLSDHLLWLTPFGKAAPRQLGLSRGRGSRLKCDRMAHRFEVETDAAIPWSSIRDQYEPALVEMLECAPGAKPSTWYVSRAPIPISVDVRSENAGQVS